jgi:hypothetical protein
VFVERSASEGMHLSSLPDRPFELAELRELNESGRFRAVFPGAVFDLEGTDRKLVPVAVLVTPGKEENAGDGREPVEQRAGENGPERRESRVVGIGYGFEAGWVRVTSDPAGDEVREQVERASEALRDWAEETDQRWAGPDGATALVEHVRERADGK